MSEQLLDGLQVGVVVEHCSCKRMPEDMRAVALLRSDHREVLLDDCPHLGRCHSPSASLVEEEGFVPCGVLSGEGIALAEVAAQAVAELIAVRDDALFVSLAGHLQLHLIQIDILVVEAHELRESYASGIECEQYHAVAAALISVAEEVAVEEAVRDFGSAKDFTLWAWYANRIGVNNFLELYFEQKSVMRECRLRNPAAAFHARLKRFYAAYVGERGGRS